MEIFREVGQDEDFIGRIAAAQREELEQEIATLQAEAERVAEEARELAGEVPLRTRLFGKPSVEKVADFIMWDDISAPDFFPGIFNCSKKVDPFFNFMPRGIFWQSLDRFRCQFLRGHVEELGDGGCRFKAGNG